MTERRPEVSALEEVSHAAFSGVLRALEARNLTIGDLPGPITIGLVAWPQVAQMPSEAAIKAVEADVSR